MGSFEDKIKSKFENASVEFDAEAWQAVDQKLDQGQMSDLLFSQKVANAFHFTAIPYSPKHWNAIQPSLNELQQENTLKGKFDEAVYSGPVLGWEKMEQKIADAQLNSFELGFKNKLTSAKVSYQSAHWEALLKTMVWRDRIKAIKISASLALIGLSAFLLINSNVNTNDISKGTLNENDKAAKLLNIGNTKKDSEFGQIQKKSIKTVEDLELLTLKQEITNAGIPSELKDTREGVVTSGNFGFVEDKNRSIESSTSSKSDFNKRVFNQAEDEKNTEKITEKEGFLTQKDNELSRDFGAGDFYQVTVKDQELSLLENTLPILNKTTTDVALLEEKESFFHIGLAPVFAFWDNPSVTGLYGQQQFSFCGDREWISYQKRNEDIGFEWKQPTIVKVGYEYSFKNSGFSLGTYLNNKRTDNWNYSELSLTSSYQMNLGSSLLRVGASANYLNNSLETSGLELREQVYDDGQVFTRERNVGNVDVNAEQLLKFNIGTMLLSKYYLLSYEISSPAILHVNHEEPVAYNQSLTIGGNLPLYKLKLTALLTVDRTDVNSFTPGLAMSYNNHWFSLLEYQNLERFNYNVGRQFNNGFRMFVSYGSIVNREVQSVFRQVYSVDGHIGLGINWVIK